MIRRSCGLFTLFLLRHRASAAWLRSGGSKCDSPVEPIRGLDLEEYARASWYIHQQQENTYQPKEDLYCVAATYDPDQEFKDLYVPFFNGPTIGVYNYANRGKVNGDPVGSPQGQVLCARELDEDLPSSLLVAPCFLPNLFAGPYWVIAVGESPGSPEGPGGGYEWAVVSAGPPTEASEDGETCTTKNGLWIFSRYQDMPSADLEAARKALTDLGFDLSKLLDVPQEGCEYDQATLKE